jgi:hypothetical protein
MCVGELSIDLFFSDLAEMVAGGDGGWGIRSSWGYASNLSHQSSYSNGKDVPLCRLAKGATSHLEAGCSDVSTSSRPEDLHQPQRGSCTFEVLQRQ